MRITRLLLTALLVLCCCSILLFSPASHADSEQPDAKAEKKSADAAVCKEALSEFNDLIGGWRGVGLPRRGSNKGAWSETADWQWDFTGKSPALKYEIEKGKLLKSALLTFDAEEKQFALKATFADEDKTVRELFGKLDDGLLVLQTAEDDKADSDYRVTIRRLNEKRTLVLIEQREPERTRFTRLAEVGYTRKGTSLAVEGLDGPECIVTGGKGTMAVTYKGKTYYVCCTGCRQAFEDDPSGVIADYEQKLAERKAKREAK